MARYRRTSDAEAAGALLVLGTLGIAGIFILAYFILSWLFGMLFALLLFFGTRSPLVGRTPLGTLFRSLIGSLISVAILFSLSVEWQSDLYGWYSWIFDWIGGSDAAWQFTESLRRDEAVYTDDIALGLAPDALSQLIDNTARALARVFPTLFISSLIHTPAKWWLHRERVRQREEQEEEGVRRKIVKPRIVSQTYFFRTGLSGAMASAIFAIYSAYSPCIDETLNELVTVENVNVYWADGFSISPICGELAKTVSIPDAIAEDFVQKWRSIPDTISAVSENSETAIGYVEAQLIKSRGNAFNLLDGFDWFYFSLTIFSGAAGVLPLLGLLFGVRSRQKRT